MKFKSKGATIKHLDFLQQNPLTRLFPLNATFGGIQNLRKKNKVIIFIFSVVVILLAVAFYGIVIWPSKLAAQILFEGGYPPLPKGAKIEHVNWNHRWIDTGGLLPTVELIFWVDPATAKTWISSVDPQRDKKTIGILERNENFNETNGFIKINLMISYK